MVNNKVKKYIEYKTNRGITLMDIIELKRAEHQLKNVELKDYFVII